MGVSSRFLASVFGAVLLTAGASAGVGSTLHTVLQRDVEGILFSAQKDVNASEVFAMVMDAQTGAVLSVARADRNASSLKHTDDVSAVFDKLSQHAYEPGSVLSPIVASIALDAGVMTPQTPFAMHQGVFKIDDRFTIRDPKPLQEGSTLGDVIATPSYVGITQVGLKLTPETYRQGLVKFGIGGRGGDDARGHVPDTRMLKAPLRRASVAMGYGITTTLPQLMRAYSAFVGKGTLHTSHLSDERNTSMPPAVSSQTAQQMRSILIQTINQGSGLVAKVAGVTLGGKTGTFRIAQNGKYSKHYNTTFVGHVQDASGHSYVIGALVIDPPQGHHLAYQTAAPIARRIVETMIQRQLLVRSASSDAAKTMQRLFASQSDINASSSAPQTVSPLLHPQVVHPFGTYRDPQYTILVRKTYLTLRSMKSAPDVRCVHEGKILFVGKAKDLGRIVVVSHSDRLHSVYAHLTRITPDLKVGQRVHAGSVIGQAKKPMLFQLFYDGQPIDPTGLIE